MLKLIRQLIGAILFLFGSLLFLVSTVNLSADIRVAGPMNMWPPPVWVYLIFDAVFVLLAFAGVKVMGLKRMAAGAVAAVVGSLALIFIIKNQLNAPPSEGI